MLRLRCLDPGEEVEHALCISLMIFSAGSARTGHNPVAPQKSQIHKDCKEERKNQSLDTSVCSFLEPARRQVIEWIPKQLEQLSLSCHKERSTTAWVLAQMACPFMAFKPVLLHSFFCSSMANQTVIEGRCLCSQSPSPTAASLPCRSFGFNPMWPMGALPCSCCSSAKRSKTLLSPFPLSAPG